MNVIVIIGVTVGAALIIVLVIGLLSYMSSLVKSAYEIKVEIRSDMEAGLKKAEEDLTKKSKWMRQELGEDVGKMKAALEQDAERRMEAIQTKVNEAARAAADAAKAQGTETLGKIADFGARLELVERDIAALKEDAARRAAMGRQRRPAKADDAHANPADGAEQADELSADMAAMMAETGRTAADMSPEPSNHAPAPTQSEPDAVRHMELKEFAPAAEPAMRKQ